jgi:hypothetical protein
MIFHLLTLLLIGLMLAGFITWGWFFVLLPSTIAIAIALWVILIAGIPLWSVT